MQPGLGKDEGGGTGRAREEWYGPAGVAMGTQLLKPGRVSVEESSRSDQMPSRGHTGDCTVSRPGPAGWSSSSFRQCEALKVRPGLVILFSPGLGL